MKNYFSSVCTAILLPITLFSLVGNKPASAIGSQPARSNITPHTQLVSQNDSSQEDKARFTCGTSYSYQLKKRVPTTLLWNPSGKRALIQWVKQMDSHWTPEKRCQEVSQRMQEANNAGTMKFITNGKINGQRVICSATEVNGDCKNLLMTLRPGDNSLKFINEFKEVFTARSEGIIQHSSGEPQIYLRIDLNEMLRNAAKAD
jgi:Circadian oscillating protein COP23